MLTGAVVAHLELSFLDEFTVRLFCQYAYLFLGGFKFLMLLQTGICFLLAFYDIFFIFHYFMSDLPISFILILNYLQQRLVRLFKTHQFCKSLLMVSVHWNSCTSFYVSISVCHAIIVLVLFRWNLATSVCENFILALPFLKVKSIMSLRFMSYQTLCLSFVPLWAVHAPGHKDLNVHQKLS